MKLLKKLGTRPSKNGKYLESWAIFWCDGCNQEVERYLTNGLKQKSCGCVRYELTAKSNTGKKRNIEQKQKISIANKGKKRTEEQKKIYSEARKGEKNPQYGKKGELCPNWNNGSSFEPYSPEFNKELKHFILERDNYTCQCPDCEGKSNKLVIHHIDYNKKNNNQENLITLCNSCHTKTNGKKKREYFTEFYKNILFLS